MSEARQLYIECHSAGLFAPGNEAAFERLKRAADLWRETGQHFSAGVAMSRAVHVAWGHPDQMAEVHNAALGDFQNALSSNPPASPAGLASLKKLCTELGQTLWLFDADRRVVQTQIRQLDEELGQRLLSHFATSERADNYLVKGIRISTDLDGNWAVEFPDHEVDPNVEQFGSQMTLAIPSAFHLFVTQKDWDGAHEIVKKHSAAFTSHGLRGWRAVVLANVDPSRSVELFDAAADAFGEDTPPSHEELLAGGRSWSGINEQLWAKYFRARARVHEAIRSPAEVRGLIERSVESLKGTESGWHSGQVSKFRILVMVLAKLVSDPTSLNPEKARKEYLFETRLFDEDDFDHLALTFISETANALKGYQDDPASELTRNHLSSALDALGRVPLIGPEVVDAVRPAIGKSALHALLGPVRTWMHRSLESITDEGTLRSILLRLLQAGLPLYSQVRHGPVEYGKDIVALLDTDGELVLYFYQVKCGDINKSKWRESRDELEEMFLVPIGSLQLPASPARKIGVLICNGHANPFVEPVMDSWFQEQRDIHGNVIEFRHLDWLVDWITDKRLVNEFKLALADHGITITMA